MRPEGSQRGDRDPWDSLCRTRALPALLCTGWLRAGACLWAWTPPHTTGRAGVAQGHQDLSLAVWHPVIGWIFLTSFFCPPPNLPSQHRNCLLMLTTTQITN